MIGVFDSGLGGLTALKELLTLLPDEKFLYLADTAHLPYGKKTRGDVCRFSARAVSFLKEMGADTVLLACGTASSLAFDFCKRYFTCKLFEVAEPSVLAAVCATRSRRIGVAATEATIKSGVFPRLFQKYAPDCMLSEACCPSLVSLAELGERDDNASYDAVRESLAPFVRDKVDTLILGCTHFALLYPYIHALLPSVALIESGKEGARALIESVRGNAAQGGTHRQSAISLRLFSTGDAECLSQRASLLLQRRVRAEKLNQDII